MGKPGWMGAAATGDAGPYEDEPEGEIAHCDSCGFDYYTVAAHECRHCGHCLPSCTCPADGSDG